MPEIVPLCRLAGATSRGMTKTSSTTTMSGATKVPQTVAFFCPICCWPRSRMPPSGRGTCRQLYRFDFLMAYRKHKKLQPLVGDVAEADNLTIMSTCKDIPERESK